MRRPVAFGVVLAAGLLPAACTAPSPPPVPTPPRAAAPTAPDFSAQVSRLREDFAREVPDGSLYNASGPENWIGLTQAALAASPYKITTPQLLVAVDRDPSVQQLRIILANPYGPWAIIGGSKISTGRAGRRGFFITPTGVFAHDGSILDYRALGTYNENHIRGLGLKGSRVWDFGWQVAEKGWRTDQETGEIRLLLHATDPDVLAPRLGRPDSKGCVRIPATMNAFLDRHAVLDADYLVTATADPRYAAILSPQLDPTPLAGRYLVIFDSGLR